MPEDYEDHWQTEDPEDRGEWLGFLLLVSAFAVGVAIGAVIF